MSPGRGGPLRSRRMSLTRIRLDAPRSCRSFCRVPAHMRGGCENDRSGSRYRWCRARIGAGRLVRSAMGRLLSRGLRWCWFPIGKLRRTCIRYDRCRRRLVCGQPWLPGVVHGPGTDMLAKYGIGRCSKIRCYLASDPITNESPAPQSTDVGRHSEEGFLVP
jgi:hypothetical protein